MLPRLAADALSMRTDHSIVKPLAASFPPSNIYVWVIGLSSPRTFRDCSLLAKERHECFVDVGLSDQSPDL